jgi:GNAT superfamily N-acetyltransferase
MNTKIRIARLHDASTIAEFNSLMAEETEHRSLDGPTLRRGVRALLRDRSKGVYYVAESGGEVVAQLMITYEWSDWRNGTFWWIQSVYVRKDYRKQGVFRSLYNHVRKLAAKRKGICGLRLYVERKNHRAQSAYETLGMERAPYEMFEKDFVL